MQTRTQRISPANYFFASGRAVASRAALVPTTARAGDRPRRCCCCCAAGEFERGSVAAPAMAPAGFNDAPASPDAPAAGFTATCGDGPHAARRQGSRAPRPLTGAPPTAAGTTAFVVVAAAAGFGPPPLTQETRIMAPTAHAAKLNTIIKASMPESPPA